jgi:hypothetical protein
LKLTPLKKKFIFKKEIEKTTLNQEKTCNKTDTEAQGAVELWVR